MTSSRPLPASASFKGTMSAAVVAAAVVAAVVADGVRDAGGVPDRCPVARRP